MILSVSHRHRYQLVGDLNALEPGGPDDRLLLHQQLHAAGAMPKSTWKVAVAPFFPARGFSTGAAAIPRPDGTPPLGGPPLPLACGDFPHSSLLNVFVSYFCKTSACKSGGPACLPDLPGASSLVERPTPPSACAACAPSRYWLRPSGPALPSAAPWSPAQPGGLHHEPLDSEHVLK